MLKIEAWAAAKVYCQDFGMRLGRISSQAQMTFLVGKNNITGFGGKLDMGRATSDEN